MYREYEETLSGKINYSASKGVIYLDATELTFGMIAHEVTHAVLGYFRTCIEGYTEVFSETIDTQEDYWDNKEELYAFMVEGLVDQIERLFYKFYYKE